MHPRQWKIIAIIIIILGALMAIGGFLVFFQTSEGITKYETLNKTGTESFANVTLVMNANHTYWAVVEISANARTISATIFFTVDDEQVGEQALLEYYDTSYSDDAVSTSCAKSFSPEGDSELVIILKDINADRWKVWIYKDLPPLFEQVAEASGIIFVIGFLVIFLTIIIYKREEFFPDRFKKKKSKKEEEMEFGE